jgi:hypothetical protein
MRGVVWRRAERAFNNGGNLVVLDRSRSADMNFGSRRLVRWRRRRSRVPGTFLSNEYSQSSDWLRPGIATVVRVVHRLQEAITFAISPFALGPIVDRELALEDIAKQRHWMRVPSSLRPWLERDLHGRDPRSSANWIPDRLPDHGPTG